MNDLAQNLSKQLRQHLAAESFFGVTEVASAVSAAAVTPSKAEALAALYEQYKNCSDCTLSRTRTHVVFGEGDPEARLLFVGEAPGFEEDKQARPFVGAAGQLLTKIIQAMKMSRSEVYIANCLKCRPPDNRSPLPVELESCSPILSKQIQIIQPKVICALGKFAAQTLLKSQEPISRMRGRFYELGGIKVMPTFHPAYLLRNPEDKKLVWGDVQLIMQELRV